MRKSSAIFVSAIALGLAMCVPLKASAQGVTIYIGPGYPGYSAGYPAYGYYPPYPRYYGYSYPSYGYAYPSYGYGYGMAVRITALIGAITDALLAELIGDGIAGIKEGVIAPRRSVGSFASSERCADFTYSLSCPSVQTSISSVRPTQTKQRPYLNGAHRPCCDAS